MSFDRTKPYLVINENYSYVNVPTKSGGIMLPPATYEQPSQCQVYFDDIMMVNGASDVFKNGTLFFEPEYEAAIYNELRITNWESILHNKEIEDNLLSPTIDFLNTVIGYSSKIMFDRVRSVYIGMRNAGMDVPQKTRTVIEERQREFERGVLTTKIRLTPVSSDADKIAALERKMAELAAQVENKPTKNVEVKDNVATDSSKQTVEQAKAPAQAKKKSPGRPKKTTTK